MLKIEKPEGDNGKKSTHLMRGTKKRRRLNTVEEPPLRP